MPGKQYYESKAHIEKGKDPGRSFIIDNLFYQASYESEGSVRGETSLFSERVFKDGKRAEYTA